MALILSAFAIWGTLVDGGPFAATSLNNSFLLLLIFISAHGAEPRARRRRRGAQETQEEYARAQSELDQRVRQRTEEWPAPTRAAGEIDRRKMIEAELGEQRGTSAKRSVSPISEAGSGTYRTNRDLVGPAL